MATVTVALSPSYASPQRAAGFNLKVGEGKASLSIELTFEEGLKLLREVTAAAKTYRDAIQADLEVTARLAAAEPPPPGRGSRVKSRTLTKDEKLDCVARVALALGDNKAGHDAFLRILGDAEKRFKIAEQAEESLANIIDDKKSKLASVEAEIARLRAVLAWASERSGLSGRGMIAGLCLGSIQDATEAALRGDWDAVRAAGVALPEEGE